MKENASATVELDVGGMDCASCASAIDSAVRRIEGVHDVRVDVVGGKVRVDGSDVSTVREKIADAVRGAGFTVHDVATGTSASVVKLAPSLPRGRLVLVLTSGVALVLGLVARELLGQPTIALFLLAIATVSGGWYVAPRGLRAARNRTLDMNFLMTTAASGAWIIGEPAEGAATLFLFAVAEMLESLSMGRARNAIRALMEVSPPAARVLRAGRETLVPVADVEVGESVIVRAGEKLPVDGVVLDGRSSVNQAPITGESLPVDKEPGSKVFAGTLNGHGLLSVQASKPATDTTLARIIHAVEEAQASRAPTQRFVDRFAAIYTPVVVLIALLLALVPPLLGLGTWDTWIYRALAMLVVACPCALVISTPVTIVSGLAGAARAGVLIKGGSHLETFGRVQVLAIDKTGTLTRGEPTVTEVAPMEPATVEDVLRVAIAVERHSEHPLARAVLAHGAQRNLVPLASAGFHAMVGRGARGVLDGTEIFVGNSRLGDELGVSTDATRAVMERFESQGKTAVLVIERAERARLLGIIAIADQPRSEARAALAALHAAGITRVVMLTGDNAGAARTVATAVGLDEVHATLLPDDKVRIVRELQADGMRVAFVGDGVNDAPALAAASVGIAMGAAGTDVALETADIALMTDDLMLLPRAVHFSRKTLSIVQQNIVVSLAIKVVFLALAVGGWATLWMAVAADMGGSLVVVANGLRARHA